MWDVIVLILDHCPSIFFPVPGRPTIWMIVGQWPIALVVGAGGELFGHFCSSLSFLSSFSLSLGKVPIWTETLCQRAIKPKTTNQPMPLACDSTQAGYAYQVEQEITYF